MTLSLIGQCPMSKSCKLFPYTTVCSSGLNHYFLVILHKDTHTQTHPHTQTDMSILYLQLVYRNYNDISSNKTMTMISVIGNQFNLQARENCISLQQISYNHSYFSVGHFEKMAATQNMKVQIFTICVKIP